MLLYLLTFPSRSGRHLKFMELHFYWKSSPRDGSSICGTCLLEFNVIVLKDGSSKVFKKKKKGNKLNRSIYYHFDSAQFNLILEILLS